MTSNGALTQLFPVQSRSQWVRHGDCNSCGDCCRQATTPVQILVQIDDGAYGRARYGEPTVTQVGDGFTQEYFAIRGPILMPCPQQVGDLCGIHDTKPYTCSDLPRDPEELEGLPRCSYFFVNQLTGEIRGTVTHGE